MSHETYQPIACSQYDLYEIAIMRGRPVDLAWCDEGGVVRQARLTPVALETRAGEEFLLLQQDPQQPGLLVVRLDRIRHLK
jgi:transcriptional antiterminator Rof (Rho-off)